MARLVIISISLLLASCSAMRGALDDWADTDYSAAACLQVDTLQCLPRRPIAACIQYMDARPPYVARCVMQVQTCHEVDTCDVD